MPSDGLNGDCLLHAEHHIFDTDCYDHFAEIIRALRYLFPQESLEQHLHRYCLAYEAKVLCKMMREIK